MTRKWRVLKWTGLTLVALVAIAVILRLVIFDLAGVPGREMWPTVGEGGWVLVNRRATPGRGDLIVFRDPEGHLLVRRVIALPGETITIKDGIPHVKGLPDRQDPGRQVMIENRPFIVVNERIGGAGWQILDDTYRRMTTPLEKKVEGGYFVLSDNREHARDSRHFGPIAPGQIRGVVSWVVSTGELP